MSILTLAQAKSHLRIDGNASDAYLLQKIEEAERAALDYIDCDIYEEDYELAAAIAAVPADLAAAKAVYDASYAAALLIADAELSEMECKYASTVYSGAIFKAARTRQGVVANGAIRAAIQLLLEFLVEKRDECEAAAHRLLSTYRACA